MSPPSNSADVQTELDTLVVVKLWAVLTRFEARLAQELSALGLTVASFRLVGEVMRSPEGIGQAELARRLGVRPPTVSAAITRLAASGVVERTPDPNDSRAYLIRLAADAPLSQGAEVLAGLEQELVAGLEPEQRAQFLELLELALDRLSPTP